MQVPLKDKNRSTNWTNTDAVNLCKCPWKTKTDLRIEQTLMQWTYASAPERQKQIYELNKHWCSELMQVPLKDKNRSTNWTKTDAVNLCKCPWKTKTDLRIEQTLMQWTYASAPERQKQIYELNKHWCSELMQVPLKDKNRSTNWTKTDAVNLCKCPWKTKTDLRIEQTLMQWTYASAPERQKQIYELNKHWCSELMQVPLKDKNRSTNWTNTDAVNLCKCPWKTKTDLRIEQKLMQWTYASAPERQKQIYKLNESCWELWKIAVKNTKLCDI